ncbi:MAG: hypothetical protein UY04_C0012G0008 [Parcubacteria group bacterium GW2011_GWA2_47_7]|nr:MAG: hypothetical protein UY04_C0012G0008 [Parcubacteria group bacterium GW2011_GWA2_47_7]
MTAILKTLTQYVHSFARYFYTSLTVMGGPANEATPCEQAYWVNQDRPF